MSALLKPTAHDYLAHERQADYKSEFCNGEFYAMAGASKEHGTLAMNIGASLHGQLRKKPCQVWASDMRVKVNETGLYTYPDLVVACGQPRFEDTGLDTLLNPVLIIEVLSAGTEKYDRGDKFQHYQKLPSLQTYVLVSQERMLIEVFSRHENHWIYQAFSEAEALIPLPSIGCTLVLGEVYEKVSLPATEGA